MCIRDSYRSRIYIYEYVTKELWLYNIPQFKSRNTNYKYDYSSSMASMIMYEFVRRLFVMAKLVFIFGVISLINGMIIRMIIKGASVVVYPILMIQECIRRNQGFGF